MFCEVSGHKGIDIGEMLEKCLSDWELKDVFTVTLDNVSANKVAMDYLKTSIVSKTGAEERDKYLHVRCAAHVLALVVKDAVRVYNKSIARIRSVVKYIKGSPSRLAKLKRCAKLVGIESKVTLILDVKTRWNNTCLMLQAAEVFEKAFIRLERYDKEYRQLFYYPKQTSTKVTTNTFLWQLVIIYEQLVEFRYNVDEDPFIATMAGKMFKKYNKYWGDYAKMNPTIFFAMLLDPREKEKGLQFALDLLYGKSSSKVESVMKLVKLDFKILFEEYKDVYSVHEESSSSIQGQAKTVVSKPVTGPSRMKELMSRSKRFKKGPNDDEGKTELDKYYIDEYEQGIL
ncbi:zinc finger BED domain-containing protein RICESLEEPER 2-like [Papaver somniferum]|uniref:zinc finger BED domain-containing protein RICESLEEPER 2-like n=1 Tax=Papaver somniferum TaxID=3469 RepID=UPI000E6FDCF1|nr:zinc finger BED domain-containing protein RICESLEEPER 2-like [Papaver somniferum]